MSFRSFLSANSQKLRRLFLYAVFGAAGTAVNVLIFVLLAEKCGANYLAANLAAWIFSVAFAFATNKAFVFESRSWAFPLWLKECAAFTLARIATCVFDWGCMFLAVSVLGWSKTASKIIANIIVVIANYALSRIWIFRTKSATMGA